MGGGYFHDSRLGKVKCHQVAAPACIGKFRYHCTASVDFRDDEQTGLWSHDQALCVRLRPARWGRGDNKVKRGILFFRVLDDGEF